MIDFHFKSDLILEDKEKYSDWITRVIQSEAHSLGDIDYIFCDDDYLLEINKEYLEHDTLTDIITFDYSEAKFVSGDIFISSDRVEDNATSYGVDFNTELLRVMCHGILHLLGYGDKSEDEQREMRLKEDEKIKMFHVEL
ncbi:rRNA maturation RNase YbeY [Flagellimonas sp. HMM57]|uniref:rRNA maturation RNase YbeY n=1 Tax=unclassified Flagellimonas TaxID=2644544 RepID=UPI0013CF5573|nr:MULTISPECIES: rRNA maturation RNase YbeY [unclassified Flagellimonas]UII77624.1 rRNA maturation RNase YbeY [Flagellimonas sp. HMM57]